MLSYINLYIQLPFLPVAQMATMATTAKAFMMTTVIYKMGILKWVARLSCSVGERGRTDERVTDGERGRFFS